MIVKRWPLICATSWSKRRELTGRTVCWTNFLDGIVTLLILVVLGLLVSIRRWPEWFRRACSAHWPTISATVESGEVSTFRGRSRYSDRAVENAVAQLGYSYQLNGTYYSGYHTQTFSDEQEAWIYVDSLKGKTIEVSYNPRKPDVSVLRRQQPLS